MNDVLTFWFDDLEPSQQFKRSSAVDGMIAARFTDTYHRVVAGETDAWRDSPGGRLAEIIVLDQFARNLFRGDAQAFVADPLALALAQELVRRGEDRSLSDERRVFAYMPYMHSESALIHERAVELFTGLPNLEYELGHKAIIDRFGRYPHRNAALGRESTTEEIGWMTSNKGF